VKPVRKSLVCLSMAVFSLGAFYSESGSRAAIVPLTQAGDVHLAPKSLAYRYQDMFMAANVVGYNYIGGMMLPLSFTADMTGSYVDVNYQSGVAEGWIESPETEFRLDIANRRLVIGGQERVLPQGVVTLVGREIYVDASFLSSVLPVDFQVAYDTNIIALQPQKPLRVFQRMDFVNRYFEDIRKQAGLPYKPWTLEQAIAASEPEENAIVPMQPPPSVISHQMLAGDSAENVRTQTAIAPLLIPESREAPVTNAPYIASGVSSNAPTGAVATQENPPPSLDADESGQPLRPHAEEYNIALDTTKGGALAEVGNPVLNDDRLLILQPEINRMKGDYIEVYQHDGGAYLPLGHLMDMLELGIGVNPATMEASGFFIDETNTFYLNGQTGEAIIRGERMSFPKGLVVANPFELYVDAQLLAQLLPLDFQLNMSTLALVIEPNEKLPLQARLERGEKWSRLAMWQQHNNSSRTPAAVVEVPYKALSVPSTDVRLGVDYDSETQTTRNRASVVASGDLGYLSTETFASVDRAGYTDNETRATVRFKAGRADREGRLLGPLQAKEVYVGDVQSYSMPLVASTELGRGFKVSNRELLRPDQFDETDFYGDAQPGWEVELYQNNVLIDFQVVAEDGRYAFTNVPINYGDNTFRIVQYGPQGQKLEEVREFNIDDQMPRPGKVQYALSVNEYRKGLVELQETETTAGRSEGLAVVSMAEYGIKESLSLGAGYAHVPVSSAFGQNVGEYDFATANLRTSIMGMRTNFDTAYDLTNGGWGVGATGLALYGRTSVRAEQRLYEDFQSAERLRSFLRPLSLDELLNDVGNERISSTLRTRTDVSVNRPVALGSFGNITATGNLLYETFEQGEVDGSISGRIAKNYRGSNIATGLRYRTLDTGEQKNDYIDGTLSLRQELAPDLLLRAAALYEFMPDLEIKTINFSLQKQWSDDVMTRLDYTESLSDGQARRIGGYLTWDFDAFYLSPRFEIDEDYEYLVGLEMQFSLGRDARRDQWLMSSQRMANTGSVTARAFLDENADGVMNDDEEPLEGVTFNNRTHTADEQGMAYIPRLTSFQPREVRVDVDSVAVMGAKPKERAYAVVSHPGVNAELDYPVVPTLEIEGNAYLQKEGERLAYPGLALELVSKDGEVVRELRTEYDGYYYLSDVYPGQYTLRVAQKEVESKNLIVDSYEIDTVALRGEGAEDGYVGGYDFLVNQEVASAPLSMTSVEAEETEELSAPLSVEGGEPTRIANLESLDEAASSALRVPSTPQITETRRVFVQAGMYCDYANAQRQVDTLTVAGFNAVLKGRSFKGQSCYMVHVGPAKDLAAAEGITQQLQDIGIGKAIIIEEDNTVYE
jgi:cell division septation protein DedD